MPNPPHYTRARVALILLGAALVLTVMWYALVDGPRARLLATQRARADISASLEYGRKQIAEAAKTSAAIAAAALRLQAMEKKIPVGDPYRWLVKAFLEFPAATRVTLANIEPPHISDSVLLPKVPYQTASFTLTGTAHYHDFGAFLAELENHFPHMRIRRVDLTPGYPGEPSSPEAERLNFQLEILALFKP